MTIVETIAVAYKRDEDDICSLIVAENANVLCSNSEKDKINFGKFESPSAKA